MKIYLLIFLLVLYIFMSIIYVKKSLSLIEEECDEEERLKVFLGMLFILPYEAIKNTLFAMLTVRDSRFAIIFMAIIIYAVYLLF